MTRSLARAAAAVRRNAASAALLVSCVALVASFTGAADAARKAVLGGSTKPKPFGLLRLGKNAKFPASAIPTVAVGQARSGR